MLKYDHLVEACLEIGLNSKKRGHNEIGANSWRMDTFKDPFDFTSINFPLFELDQIIMIGKIINNLISQSQLVKSYNLTSEEGKVEYKTNRAIMEIIPIMDKSINYWLSKGLEKCDNKKELVIHNGFVYEIDPSFKESMERMNKSMKELRRDYLCKMQASWEKSKDIILD